MQRIVIERGEAVVLGKDLRHHRIEVNQRNLLDSVVFENLAHRHPVTPAQHQRPTWRRHRGQPRVDERFVVAVLVEGRELEVTVEKETDLALLVG